MVWRRRTLYAFAMAVGILCQGSGEAETRRYYVAVNQARVLDTPEPINKVSVANSGIVDVTVLSPQQLLLTAKAVGQTSLLLFHGKTMTSYDVTVHTPPISEGTRVNPQSDQFHSVLVQRADKVTSQVFARDDQNSWVELGTVTPATEARK
jgi:Flp pilus assembly secretin CpaC